MSDYLEFEFDLIDKSIIKIISKYVEYLEPIYQEFLFDIIDIKNDLERIRNSLNEENEEPN